MTSLPIAPPSARVGTALKSSAPPPGAAGGDFAALLNDTTARTAHAEGPKTRQQDAPRRDAAAPRSDDDGAPKADRSGATPAAQASKDDAAPAADPKAPAQPAAEAPAPQVPATPPAPPADPAAAAAQAAAQAALAQQQPQPAVPAAATQGAPGQPATPKDGVPIDPKALLQAADAQAPADPKAAATDGAPGQFELPAALLNAKGDGKAGDHAKGGKDGQAKHELPPAPTLPPTAGAAATPTASPTTTPVAANAPQADVAQAAPQAPAPVAQGQPTATPQTVVPTAAGAGLGGAALTRASVVQTAERVQELVRIATTRNGNARATLQLKPEALGQVDVHLRTTREGLVATIAAHDQAGLDALQQAGGDLKRMLEDRGVQLHSLDLQLGAGADQGFSNQADARQASSGRSGGAASYDLDGDEDVTAEDLTFSTAPLTATSTLVDVSA